MSPLIHYIVATTFVAVIYANIEEWSTTVQKEVEVTSIGASLSGDRVTTEDQDHTEAEYNHTGTSPGLPSLSDLWVKVYGEANANKTNETLVDVVAHTEVIQSKTREHVTEGLFENSTGNYSVADVSKIGFVSDEDEGVYHLSTERSAASNSEEELRISSSTEFVTEKTTKFFPATEENTAEQPENSTVELNELSESTNLFTESDNSVVTTSTEGESSSDGHYNATVPLVAEYDKEFTNKTFVESHHEESSSSEDTEFVKNEDGRATVILSNETILESNASSSPALLFKSLPSENITVELHTTLETSTVNLQSTPYSTEKSKSLSSSTQPVSEASKEIEENKIGYSENTGAGEKSTTLAQEEVLLRNATTEYEVSATSEIENVTNRISLPSLDTAPESVTVYATFSKTSAQGTVEQALSKVTSSTEFTDLSVTRQTTESTEELRGNETLIEVQKQKKGFPVTTSESKAPLLEINTTISSVHTNEASTERHFTTQTGSAEETPETEHGSEPSVIKEIPHLSTPTSKSSLTNSEEESIESTHLSSETSASTEEALSETEKLEKGIEEGYSSKMFTEPESSTETAERNVSINEVTGKVEHSVEATSVSSSTEGSLEIALVSSTEGSLEIASSTDGNTGSVEVSDEGAHPYETLHATSYEDEGYDTSASSSTAAYSSEETSTSELHHASTYPTTEVSSSATEGRRVGYDEMELVSATALTSEKSAVSSPYKKGIAKKMGSSKHINWHPYIFDCKSEIDEKGLLCRDWSRGGLCETHRATMFLFCRRTCLCTGPPVDIEELFKLRLF